MIGLITQNNIRRTVLSDILTPLKAEGYRADHTYRLLLVTDGPTTGLPDLPMVTLGCTSDRAIRQLKAPIRPADLLHQLTLIRASLENQTTFENGFFLFQNNQRRLTDKETGRSLSLTEKESELLTALTKALPNSLTKEELLQSVWRYSPDTETHTVESHIYLLRQKLGNRADSLIKSTTTGYTLVTD